MSSNQFLSRDEYRKKKELEEARKAGTAPAELDEDGNEINPHIPQYIAQAPWYLNTNHPTLSHQKKPGGLKRDDKILETKWYQRGAKGKRATKYRKGACTNCGAMTHKTKDCCERPRRKGAKLTNRDIAADEVITQVNVKAYDAKRDAWNGYDPSLHTRVIEKFEEVEAERRLIKAQNLATKGDESDSDSDSSSDDDDGGDDANKADDVMGLREQGDETQVQKMDAKRRTTIRNLRIREDTAKYLYNLNPNSAHYDPKTRSMRENPLPHMAPDDAPFAGDNFVRHSGMFHDMQNTQRFAWDAAERGMDVHMTGAPSQAELLHKQFREKKETLEKKKKNALLEKYGGSEHLNSLPKELLTGQSEDYREYSRDGRLVKGLEKAVVRSKYVEDVFVNNHTAVWGSFWDGGRWGYACCHQFTKNSYCTGEAGKKAQAENVAQSMARMKKLEEERRAAAARDPADIEREREEKARAEEKARKKRLKEALKREEKFWKEDAELDVRKRKYNSMHESTEVTEEDMEAYYRKRPRAEDPMTKFADAEKEWTKE